MKNGVKTSFNGLVKYNSKWYYVKSGVVNTSYTGLVKHTDGKWYYVKKGVKTSYTGTVTYNGKKYKVKKLFDDEDFDFVEDDEEIEETLKKKKVSKVVTGYDAIGDICYPDKDIHINTNIINNIIFYIFKKNINVVSKCCNLS